MPLTLLPKAIYTSELVVLCHEQKTNFSSQKRFCRHFKLLKIAAHDMVSRIRNSQLYTKYVHSLIGPKRQKSKPQKGSLGSIKNFVIQNL